MIADSVLDMLQQGLDAMRASPLSDTSISEEALQAAVDFSRLGVIRREDIDENTPSTCFNEFNDDGSGAFGRIQG